MKVNPNKIVTIFASFSGATQELDKQVTDVSARLYKGDQHIKDLEAVKLGSPMSWTAQHIFPADSAIGDDYKVDFEVKIKDQKDSIIETQEIQLVRDLNLQSHVEIKDIPLVVQDSTFEEVPNDIKAYLEKKNE
jgi:hypothetical protein